MGAAPAWCRASCTPAGEGAFLDEALDEALVVRLGDGPEAGRKADARARPAEAARVWATVLTSAVDTTFLT